MVVWYPGLYHLPRVTSRGDVIVLKGINDDAPIRTNSPLTFASPGEYLRVRFRVACGAENVSVHFAFYGTLSNISSDGNFTIMEYRAPIPGNRPTGYYPFFVTAEYNNETYAMLAWVAVLRRPIVEITNYPSEIFGNELRHVVISGRVYYPDGTPVPGGVVRVTLNQSKGVAGFNLGSGIVRNGVFNVSAVVRDSIPPGKYQLIAYYRGYAAAPSDSDPVVSIRREPQLRVEDRNGTLSIRLYWKNVPLSNRTLRIVSGNKSLAITTDENGLAVLSLESIDPGEVRVLYDGDDLYLPVNRLVRVKVGTASDRDASTSLISRLLKYLPYLRLPLFLLAASVVAVSVGRRIRRPNVNIHGLVRDGARIGKAEFIEPRRRVFIPGESVYVSLSEEAPLEVDGNVLGEGREFDLALSPGRHLLRTNGDEMEVHVLPVRNAVLALYELHFLPFARSSGIFERPLTPYEIVNRLSSKGLDRKSLSTIADIFVRARYSDLPVGEEDFWRLLRAMERLGVFE
ncbi:hypothetical protein A3L11_10830 [Thermococcus siculi]|uniref:Protein-glutamine gamma-glutamyltransferase-like C-terminal domain-containing protein n=2 Tax=Thermococcus siculi TaxID=72803 RepID=A0A2Z2MR12_9EURY|nr:hypothetical protein A3L11_10830 [Thermococcus siculi]